MFPLNRSSAVQIRTAEQAAAGGRLWRLAAGLALAATYFLYQPSLGFQFVYDDLFQIVNNRHLDSWRFLPLYFTQHVWSQVPGIAANFYRPFFLLWLRLNNLAFGHEAAGWHFTTVMLHVLVTALVYLLARRLMGSRVSALIAALVFGFHPVHVEAVAWVSGVTEPLSAAFFLASLLCYMRQRSQQEKKTLWLIASLALFCAGMLVKETVAVLPLVILAYEFTLERKSPPADAGFGKSRAERVLLFYWILLAAYLLARTLVVHGVAADNAGFGLGWSLLTWPWLLCFYLRLLLWPLHLSPLYNPVHVSRLTQPLFLVPVLVLILGGVALGWILRKSGARLAVFLASWFLLTLAPAMVIFCLARPDEAFHDRYLYLPSVAFALALGGLFGKWWERTASGGKVLAIGLALGAAFAMALATHQQLSYWASNYVLFQRAAAIAPHNETAKLNFANELVKTREYARALQLSEQCVAQDPASARAWGSAAAASFFLADYPKAEKYYEQAVRLDPARGDLFYFLGVTRMKLDNYRDAADALHKAAAAAPQLRGVHYALGLAEIQLGDWQDAAQQFQIELRMNPGDGNARAALANAREQPPPARPGAGVLRPATLVAK
jgi:protein O-mannosyl-transferase